MACAVALASIPVLPPLSGVFTGLFGFVIAVMSLVSRWWWWADSRERAVAEGVWVARQSGYRADADGDHLRWLDQDGKVKRATIVLGDRGWNLMLHGLAAEGTHRG
jgi:hypothetical protein